MLSIATIYYFSQDRILSFESSKPVLLSSRILVDLALSNSVSSSEKIMDGGRTDDVGGRRVFEF
jgi:hypothetical protein